MPSFKSFIRGAALLLSVLLMVSVFQNCGLSGQQFKASTNTASGNGTGYEGEKGDPLASNMVINYGYGKCEGNLSFAEIQTSPAGPYLLVRENCANVNPPRIIDSNEVETSADSSSLNYQGRHFIRE